MNHIRMDVAVYPDKHQHVLDFKNAFLDFQTIMHILLWQTVRGANFILIHYFISILSIFVSLNWINCLVSELSAS